MTRIGGAPASPRSFTSQPACFSTWWRAAASAVTCAIWQPVTNPAETSVGQPQQLTEPVDADLLDDRCRGAGDVQARVLVPRGREPVGGERCGDAAADHEAEVAPARDGDGAGVGLGRELVDDGRGVRRLLGQRAAERRPQLLGRGSREDRPLVERVEEVGRMIGGRAKQLPVSDLLSGAGHDPILEWPHVSGPKRVAPDLQSPHGQGDRTKHGGKRREARRREPQGAARLPPARARRGRDRAHGHRGEVAAGRAARNIQRAYADVRDGEAWLIGSHIAAYEQGTIGSHDPDRDRKLLLHRKQIDSLFGKVRERGLTLVPTRLYFKDGRAKVELALARGKESRDKRRDLAKRDADRQIERALKSRRS